MQLPEISNLICIQFASIRICSRNSMSVQTRDYNCCQYKQRSVRTKGNILQHFQYKLSRRLLKISISGMTANPKRCVGWECVGSMWSRTLRMMSSSLIFSPQLITTDNLVPFHTQAGSDGSDGSETYRPEPEERPPVKTREVV